MAKILRLILLIILTFQSAVGQEVAGDAQIPQHLEELSDAEMLLRLQKFISTDQQRLIQLRKDLREQNRETDRMAQRFNTLDSELQKARSIDASSPQTEIIEQRWSYVRKALDLLLQRRNAVQQQIQIIENKVKKQHHVVDFITLREVPSEDTINLAEQQPVVVDTTTKKRNMPGIKNRKVLNALEDLENLEQELILVKHSLNLLEGLIKLNREDLKLAAILLETSERQISLYEEWLTYLNKAESNTTTRQLKANAQRRLQELPSEIKEDSMLVSMLEARIDILEKVYTPVVNSVNNVEKKVESARERLEFLQSPLAPHQIYYWLKYNLPRLLIIIAILTLIWFLIRGTLGIVLNKLKKRRLADERLERIETLKLASSSVITIIIIIIGVIVLLSELGVDLTVVLGGAAVISLIIAFGTQSLVKDYFSGFMILLENQYRVGNVVKINNTTGIVENISIRLTVLRDLEGIAHFIPHGQITEVSNLTHGWSQISFDIGVAYKENVDEVMRVLKELAFELKEDPEFGPWIIDDPDMLGVNAFADSAVVIKFLVKTRPLKQWKIKRELLRRIKNRFDELGIEIPFPHRTVFLRDSTPPGLDGVE